MVRTILGRADIPMQCASRVLCGPLLPRWRAALPACIAPLTVHSTGANAEQCARLRHSGSMHETSNHAMHTALKTLSGCR